VPDYLTKETIPRGCDPWHNWVASNGVDGNGMIIMTKERYAWRKPSLALSSVARMSARDVHAKWPYIGMTYEVYLMKGTIWCILL